MMKRMCIVALMMIRRRKTMRKRMVEIERGVFRDPDLLVVRASDGRWMRYGSKELGEKASE